MPLPAPVTKATLPAIFAFSSIPADPLEGLASRQSSEE
jgi:hypothetical protein